MNIKFDWDETKAATNAQKHGVTFDEAATVFYDPLAVIFDDEIRSEGERREIIIGHDAQNHLLLVCFTERAEVIRIISARPATKRELQDYEQHAGSDSQQHSDSQQVPDDDMLPEYHFDYSKARPNRFTIDHKPGSRIVVLDPDIAEVFTTPESVNVALRALIATMPKTTRE